MVLPPCPSAPLGFLYPLQVYTGSLVFSSLSFDSQKHEVSTLLLILRGSLMSFMLNKLKSQVFSFSPELRFPLTPSPPPRPSSRRDRGALRMQQEETGHTWDLRKTPSCSHNPAACQTRQSKHLKKGFWHPRSLSRCCTPLQKPHKKPPEL